MTYKKPVLFLLFLSIALFSGFSLAQSSVWKVQKGKHSLYLAGTIHLLTPEDIPLPKEFKAAFDKADSIVLEADTSQLASPVFQQKMLAAMQLQEGKAPDYLTLETWKLLSNRLAQFGVNADQLAHFRVGFILLNLTMLEIQKAGFTEKGVDERYFELAQKHQKQLNFLESPEEQLSFLLSMDSGDVNELVKYTLDDLDSINEYLDSLKTAWRNGDLEAMQAVAINDFKKDYPNIYKVILTDRNKAWLTKINKWLDTPETEAIYVGALHLAGDDGLINQLQKSGFQITQL